MTEWEWRYRPAGRCAHGFTSSSPSGRAVSRCGISPLWYDPRGWFGTGSQDEYERAAQLPKCKRCARLLGWTPPAATA